MTWQFYSVLPVWVLAVIGAVVVALTAPSGEHLEWIGIALAAVVFVTFVIQLAIQRKEGFVVRAMASIGVSVVILAVASGAIALLG